MLIFAAAGEQTINSNHIAISITGMVIVFTALTLIAVFITLLPKALAVLAPILPSESAGHGHGHAAAPSATTKTGTIDNEILVAIGFALHKETEKRR